MLLKGSNHDVLQLLKYQWHFFRKPGLTQDSTMYTEKNIVWYRTHPCSLGHITILVSSVKPTGYITICDIWVPACTVDTWFEILF